MNKNVCSTIKLSAHRSAQIGISMTMKRIYIFTGKGGVGKSSIAAAHAIKSAREGVRTLLVSTDMAHNLGDIFELPIGKEIVSAFEGLDLYEIDPEYVMEHDFGDITACINQVLSAGDGRSMEEFGMIPGMEELFSLLKISELYRENQYEKIIVDCAPTGETLSLLKFPELLSWYMEKLFPLGKVAVKLLSPVSKHLFKIELPNKTAMNDIERMYLKLGELQDLLKDRNITSIRLVAMPEKMVVEETKRNYMYMNLYNFNVDGLYINRLLPEDIQNDYFEHWVKIQKKYKEELLECFQGMPVYMIPWYDEELKGVSSIEKICADVLDGEDVFVGTVVTDREAFEKNDKGYLLTVSIPYADKKDLDLYQASSDVVIRLGNFKRNIPLPQVLRSYEITGAKLEDGCLHIQFEQQVRE